MPWKLFKKSREQASSSTPVLMATEARPQSAELVHESAPLDVCDAGEAGEGASQASKNTCSGCLIL